MSINRFQLLTMVLFLVLIAPIIGFAQSVNTAQSAKSKTKVVKNSEKTDKDKSAWSGSVGYGVSTDLARSGDRRAYRHRMDAGVGYKISDRFTVSSGTLVSWFSEGDNISNEQDNPSWDDLELSLSFADKINKTMGYSASISNAFPTGNESRQEGIRDIISGTTGLNMSFMEKLISWSNSISASKFFQSYDYSVTAADSNVDTTIGFSTGLNISVGQGLSFSVSQTWGSVRLINGENSAKSSARIGMSYGYGRYSFSLGHSLGSYSKSDGYKFLYVDDTKRSYSLGVGIDI